MGEPVTLSFIFQTIGVIVVVTAIGIVLVNRKTKQLKKEQK
jgi:hypothetical protein